MSLQAYRKWLAFGTGVGIELGDRDLNVVIVHVRPNGARVVATQVIERYAERPATEWGAEYSAFLQRNAAKPFFLYLCYYAPHTPLELPSPYAEEFTKDMPLRRRAALSMISGIDRGVGRILAALKAHNIDDHTLVFFTSDNGAPIHERRDSPLDQDMGGWDGSLNTPWVGEKGMLVANYGILFFHDEPERFFPTLGRWIRADKYERRRC